MSKEKHVRFVLTTAVGGVIFLVPVVVMAVILTKAAGFMMIVAEPMAEWLPVDTISGVTLANIIAILALVLVCFLAGLLARHALASKFVKNLESKVLVNLPGYVMIKSLVSGFDPGRVEGLKPVAVIIGSAERVGFEIEKLPDERSVVFLPTAPNPFSGINQVFPAGQVIYLDVPVKAVIEVTENFGFGLGALLKARQIS